MLEIFDLKNEKNEQINLYELTNHNELVRQLRQFKNSLFHDNIKFESMENVIKKYLFSDLKEQFQNLDNFTKNKIFFEFGYLKLGPKYKDNRTLEDDGIKGFRQYVEDNSNLDLPLNGKGWKLIIDSLDEKVVRIVGRLAFYNLLTESEKQKSLPLFELKKIKIPRINYSVDIKDKIGIDRNVSELEIKMYKKLIEDSTYNHKLD